MNAILPFPLGGKEACASGSELEKLLGQTFLAPDGKGKLRLVRLDLTAGLSGDAAKARSFEYSNTDESAATGFEVNPTEALADVTVGISPTNQETLVDGDAFLVHISGECYWWNTSGSDITEGDLIACDAGGATAGGCETDGAYVEGETRAVALDAITNGTQGPVRIIRELTGAI